MDERYITADFIGGAWDGKTYDIPFLPEWRIALCPPLSLRAMKESDMPEIIRPKYEVYKYVGYGLYWLCKRERD